MLLLPDLHKEAVLFRFGAMIDMYYGDVKNKRGNLWTDTILTLTWKKNPLNLPNMGL